MNEVVFYPGQPEDVRVGLGITVILRDNKGNWRVRSLTWRDENLPRRTMTLTKSSPCGRKTTEN